MCRANGGLIVDSFAGGGGASLGIAWATGRSPDIAINHDAQALAMHAANHPDTRHVQEDVWKADLRKLTGRRPVTLLWASPDCRHFSRAKGGKPVSKQVRSLAWVVCRWAEQVKPRVIMLENVREFETWGPLVPAWRCPQCGWRGTEGQAVLVRVRRRCPRCESLGLKQTDEMIPDPKRTGLTFRRWAGRLRNLGYDVQAKTMNAADYGAPTHRRRLFLVARCDGQRIEWPEPTHGNPKKLDAQPLFSRLKPWRTAAECIDWSLPVPSIFERDRPLADKTNLRIARGLVRYVLENPQPFIVHLTHDGPRRTHDLGKPLPTITGANRGELAVAAPYLARISQAGGNGKYANAVDEPLGSIVSKNEHCLVTPIIAQLAHGEGKDGRWGIGSAPADAPPGTIHSGGKNYALIAPTQVTVGYSERDGQAPRVPGLDHPLGTVVSGGGKHALVAAWLVKHFGGVVGVPIDTPQPTTTTIGTQNQLACAYLVRFNHGEKQWSGIHEPLGTVTSQGNKFGLVFAFLTKYFGTAVGQSLFEPLHTATGKARFGMVMVHVTPGNYEPAVALEIAGLGLHVIADIGMRMLASRELARARGFPDTYLLTGTKSSQVAKIGNSVSPYIPARLVTANCPWLCRGNREVLS
jgi:DNA (cytosine-5)-methyltransferase 1